MKTKHKKPLNLSTNQGALWDALTSSPHGLDRIAKQSGYSYVGIKNWMFGVFEPSEFAFNSVIDAIALLEPEVPARVNWKARKGELIELRRKGLRHRQIAKIMNTSYFTIQGAVLRFNV